MSLLALGFRPFFLAAGISAAALLPVWLGMLQGWLSADSHYGGSHWHAHEMLFGYAAAVIAGFLLTAVRNWTGMETPTGAWLAALAGLWLAARIAPLVPVPATLVALLDVAFFPALTLALRRPLWHGANRNNRVFLALLAAMTLASCLVHAQALGLAEGTAARGTRLMLDLTLLTLMIVSGRVMPFFTERAVQGSAPRVVPGVERLTFVLATAGLLVNLALPWSGIAGLVALSLAAVQSVRLWGWHDRRVWGIPILAVLYSGYLWLVVGFLLDGLAGIGLVPPYPALHALTVGAVGVFTLGMMARVSLGHTGRAMRSSAVTNLAFVLLNAAALVRVVATLLLPAGYTAWIQVSGLLWTLAFALFLWVYTPILIAPRVDGRPG
jgi:uncharacterized protein involved in response to NO